MTFQSGPGADPGKEYGANPYPVGDPFAAAGTAPYAAGGGDPYAAYPVDDPYATQLGGPPYPAPAPYPQQQPAYGQYPAPGFRQSPPTNGLALGSLITSVAGAVTGPFACGITLLACIVGPVLGFVALGQIRESGENGRGMAIGGIVVGIVAIALTVLILGILIALYGWVFWNLNEVSNHSTTPGWQ
jgi:hypothetical protein